MSQIGTLSRTAICLTALIVPSALLADRSQKESKNPILQPTDPSLYAGADTCKACHPSQAASYEHGPHWRTETDKHRGVQWQGCEACHGPGKAHVEAGGDVSKIIRLNTLTPKQSSERCLACHERRESHQNFMQSPHLANGVGCTTCHSVHSSTAGRTLLVKAQPTLCYGCHRNVEPDFSKPEHHRVNEGLMTCTDCHNPHGSFVSRNLRVSASQGQICTTCHVDTAGPFVFEHAPLKEQGCVACHSPHGSTNAHMLSRPNTNQVCFDCHSSIIGQNLSPNPPSFHNQAAKYQQCVLCHVAIHGSNTNPYFFER